MIRTQIICIAVFLMILTVIIIVTSAAAGGGRDRTEKYQPPHSDYDRAMSCEDIPMVEELLRGMEAERDRSDDARAEFLETDIRDVREHLDSLNYDRRHEQASSLLSDFLDSYQLITEDADCFESDGEAHLEKRRCVNLLRRYLRFCEQEGASFDGRQYFMDFILGDYDPCMDSPEALERKLEECIARARQKREDI